MREPDKFTAYADAGVSIRCRITNNAGTDITQASLSSIAYKVSYYASEDDAEEATNGTAVVSSGTLTISAVVFDTLQTPSTWTVDTAGYNFKYDSPATERASGHKWNRYDFLFTDSSSNKFRHAVIVETLPVQ